MDGSPAEGERSRPVPRTSPVSVFDETEAHLERHNIRPIIPLAAAKEPIGERFQ